MLVHNSLNVMLKLLAVGVLSSVCGVASAESNDLTSMLINLSASYPAMYRFITGLAYIIGISLIFKAIYHLKVYGELRTMMASQTSMKQPLTYIAVGAVFIYLPTAVSIMLNSTFGYGSIMSYSNWYGANNVKNVQALQAIAGMVQLIGIAAFVRGWIVITKSVQQGGQGGSAGKGVVHIIGGLCAINIYGFANIVSNSLGVSFFSQSS